jgi:hypothetical protein
MFVPSFRVFSPVLVFATMLGCAQGGVDGGAPVEDVGADSPTDDASTGDTNAGADAPSLCPPCVTETDCTGGNVCAQFGGDIYCAPPCSSDTDCSADRACTPVTDFAGHQVSVCVPRGDVCGPSSGTPDTGSPSSDSSAPPADSGIDHCGALVGPSVTAPCASCGTHPCQPNGCYSGWWCDTATKRCQAPPSPCPSPPVDAGTADVSVDVGPPPGGSVGPSGGTVSRLLFGVVGDTRPAVIDDTKAYPTAIIDKIYSDVAALSPQPAFMISTGDYMFATASGSQGAPQLDLYLAARAKYAGTWFPALGNHECTGAVVSNCGAGTTDGVTKNYEAFVSKMLGPIAKTDPWYSFRVDASDGAWTSKFVFVAANAWTPTQAAWLDATMAVSTTYTFVIRHEPSAATTAPGVSPSEAIMAKHPYTLAIVGHTHTYERKSTREVVIGNGGAPLTGSKNYGYAIVGQRPDGAVRVDMYDYTTGAADPSFGFAVKADGTAAP